jgi:DNA helicase II / ATP-dependent DNA helicase PcrA
MIPLPQVLTSRIAYLIIKHHVPASSICAVTFTNKAANEMRERLSKLIGKDQTGRLKLGTFHALCVLFLRKHGRLIGLDENFTICDADERLYLLNSYLIYVLTKH